MTTEPLIPLDDSNNNEHPIIINDNSYNGDGIKIEILLHYKHIGFRITPLGYDSQTPSVPSTNEIYNNLSYWTDEKIVKDSHLFKNVATLFGKTHLKDADGLPLYVNELDIEDKAVYDMLAMVKTKNKDCFFIDEACQNTFVTKGRKKWGLKMYWLSHKQYPCISIKNCKLGYQFEIKTDNTLGHSTLPPSYHRKDKTIHYQLIGQPKIAIMDGLYDWLLQVLADCIKEKEDDYDSSSNNNIYYHNANLILTDSETEQIAEIFLPIYKEPKRHHISVGLAGLCCKEGGISLQSAAKLSETLSDKTNDKERKSRLTDIQTTYKRWYNKEPIQGASLLAQVLGDDAPHILAKFHQILRNRRTAPIKITRNGSNIKIEIANQTHSIDFNPDPDTMFNQIMGKISTLGVEIDRHSLVAQLALIIDKDFQENSTPAERLLLMVTSRIIDSFRDETDTAFIVIEASGHKKMVNVDIEDFDEWASDMYELEYHEVLTSSTIENTKRVIRARIKNTRILHNRVAHIDKKLYYDLGEKAVEITQDGWTFVDNPCIFRPMNKTQVEPQAENKRYLKEIFADFSIIHDYQKLILEVYTIALFIESVRFPILTPYGVHGSGKSTLMEAISRIIDPHPMINSISLKAMPDDEKDRRVSIYTDYVSYFDNLQGLSQKQMDDLCRWVTGYGWTGRSLFTDSKPVSYYGTRPVGLNAINIPAIRADLLDRTFLVNMRKKHNPTSETKFLADIQEKIPYILGHIFDILVIVLRTYDDVCKEIQPNHRLADFVIWGEVISRALGNREGEFIESWTKNVENQIQVSIDYDVLTPLAIAYVFEQKENPIMVNPQKLFKDFRLYMMKEGMDHRDLPKNAATLSKRINEMEDALQLAGIELGSVKTGNIRYIQFTKKDSVYNMPIQCRYCDFNYEGNEDKRIHHMKKEHPGVCYSTNCSEEFGNENDRDAHIKNKHLEEYIV